MAADNRARSINAPDYRILVGGDIITPVIRPRLVSLNLTLSRGEQADQLTLILDDSDGQMAIPRKGVNVSVALGWRYAGVLDVGNFIIDESEHSGPPDQIHIRGRAANMREGLPEKKTKSWHQRTIETIVASIAAHHKLTPVVAKQLAHIAIDHIDQTDESDLNFLTRLGERYDAIAAIKADRLLFIPMGRARSASGQQLPGNRITRDQGDRHTYRVTDRDTYSGVIAYYRDTAAAKRQTVAAGNVDDKPKTLRKTYPTQTEAQDAANGAWRRLQRGEHALSLSLARGDAGLTPETPIQVSGFKREIDAISWVASEVTHQIGAQGFTTQLKLETVL